ncbi:hypothetical protein GP486_008842 [Trichoglossum hirsutum]|uniref:Tail assembly chaperone n=1 Tax=Trichoglossum hirsutum TaxID=265104 RepID=A0A9P8I450_9PEZI|nr:hypothetical protein GP486_008842 [Trichoglossum hirsutum]
MAKDVTATNLATEQDDLPSAVVETAPKANMTREELRAAMLAMKEPKVEKVKFLGMDIDLRQPTVGGMADMQRVQVGQNGLVIAVIQYACVPGTQDRIFEADDFDMLQNMPFDASWADVANAVGRLTSVNIPLPSGN